MDFIDTLYGRPSTLRTQKCLFNKWIRPELPVNPGNLLIVVRTWEKKKLAPRTIKSLLSLLRRHNKWATGENMDTTPWVRMVMSKKQQEAPKALTRDQARNLLNHLEGRTLTAAMIAYHSGLRKGEVFGLNWEDVDFIRGKLFVQRSYNGPTKNGRSRYVNLSKDLEMYFLDTFMIKTDNCLGSRIIDKQFDPNPTIKAACRAAGVPEITMHGFRHTFATLALDAGKPVKQVQEALGHTNVSITLDIYWSNIQGDLELGFC